MAITIFFCIGVKGHQADTWINEASRAISKYDLDYVTNLKGREDFLSRGYHPRARYSVDKTIYYGSSGGCRSIWTIDSTNGLEIVYCANSVYRFQLKRPLSNDSAWTLVSLDYIPRENSNWFLDPSLREKKDEYIFELPHRSPFRVFGGTEIVDVLNLPSFEYIDLSKDENGQITANCTYDVTGGNIGATFEFNSDDWRLKSAKLNAHHQSSGTDTTFTSTYEYGSGKFPKAIFAATNLVNPETLDDGEVLPAGMLLFTDDSKFYPDDVRQKNAADFRLSFFGLPEPDGVRWGWPPAVWISLTGVLLLGIVAWRRSRRSKTV